MWTQDDELAWDKLEEQVYTVKKRQEINLGSHLSYWCDPEGEDVHDCSMQKTIMLKDGRYGHWKSLKQLLRNQEACEVVETMWTQDAELAWDKLEEQVYTVEKRQKVNLGNKFMP
uniref:Uncharacterized protein n=1 Tax=Brassica campestris TaxID=3711 RepID=M4CV09_BRACM